MDSAKVIRSLAKSLPIKPMRCASPRERGNRYSHSASLRLKSSKTSAVRSKQLSKDSNDEDARENSQRSAYQNHRLVFCADGYHLDHCRAGRILRVPASDAGFD